jgi:dipeptidyl aminopeptidase/acylaminoacyl peptidase
MHTMKMGLVLAVVLSLSGATLAEDARKAEAPAKTEAPAPKADSTATKTDATPATPPAVEAAPAPAAKELSAPVEREFKAALDGTMQKYMELLPREFDPKKPHDVMIALHGHGSDRTQYATQARSECKGSRDVAATHEMIFISPDYRASTSWMGPAAEADLVQLIAVLKTQYKVRRVYLTGASMGGTSVLIFAALHPDLVDGALSSNGTANLEKYDKFQQAIIASYGGTKAQKPEEYRKRSPELFPKQFKMPLALTVGGKDEAVPPDSVRRLAEELKKLGKKDLLMIDRESTGHSTSYNDTVAGLEFVIKAAEEAQAAKSKGKSGAEKPKSAVSQPKPPDGAEKKAE